MYLEALGCDLEDAITATKLGIIEAGQLGASTRKAIAERQDGCVARRSSGLSPSSARISTMSLACSGAAWAGSSAFSRAMPRMTSVIARWRL